MHRAGRPYRPTRPYCQKQRCQANGQPPHSVSLHSLSLSRQKQESSAAPVFVIRQRGRVFPKKDRRINRHRQLRNRHSQPLGIRAKQRRQRHHQRAADDKSPCHRHNERRLRLHDRLKIVSRKDIERSSRNKSAQVRTIAGVISSTSGVGAMKMRIERFGTPC